jgi:hypothetical protein
MIEVVGSLTLAMWWGRHTATSNSHHRQIDR